MKRDRRRFWVAIGAAIAAVGLVAQPTFAETPISEHGTVGYYQVSDDPGANCLYETGSFDLDKITVRAPTSVHGYYTYKTWVGWQFKVLRSTDDGSTWHQYYSSPIQKDKANDSIPADGFSRMTWIAPEHPTGRFLVRVHIWFYAPGSQTNSEGHAVVEYDNYKSKWNGSHHPSTDYCLQDY